MHKLHLIVCIFHAILFWGGIALTGVSRLVFANNQPVLYQFCLEYCRIVSLLSMFPIELTVFLFSLFDRPRYVRKDLKLGALYGISWLLYIIVTIEMTGM